MTLFISKPMTSHSLYHSFLSLRLIWSSEKVGLFDWIGLKKVESQKRRQLLPTILGISLLFFFSIVVFSWFDSIEQPQQLFWSGNWSPSCYLLMLS